MSINLSPSTHLNVLIEYYITLITVKVRFSVQRHLDVRTGNILINTVTTVLPSLPRSNITGGGK